MYFTVLRDCHSYPLLLHEMAICNIFLIASFIIAVEASASKSIMGINGDGILYTKWAAHNGDSILYT